MTTAAYVDRVVPPRLVPGSDRSRPFGWSRWLPRLANCRGARPAKIRTVGQVEQLLKAWGTSLHSRLIKVPQPSKKTVSDIHCSSISAYACCMRRL